MSVYQYPAFRGNEAVRVIVPVMLFGLAKTVASLVISGKTKHYKNEHAFINVRWPDAHPDVLAKVPVAQKYYAEYYRLWPHHFPAGDSNIPARIQSGETMVPAATALLCSVWLCWRLWRTKNSH